MPDLLILISAIIGLLFSAHVLNTIISASIHWLKFRSFPKNKVELELEMLKEIHKLVEDQLETSQKENEKLSAALIDSINK